MLPREVPFSSRKAPEVPADLRLVARERIAHAVELGNTVWGRGRPPMPMPTCSFDIRGQVAGMACMSKKEDSREGWHVRLNAELLLGYPDAVLKETIPHEVAHLLVAHYFGKGVAPHGSEWQRVMRSLGKEPERSHSLPTTPARVVARPYKYRCACRTYDFTAARNKNVYQCKACGQFLQLVAGPGTPAAGLRPSPSPAGAPRSVARAPVPSPGQGPAPKPGGGPLPPTQKQLELAANLAERKKVAIPPATLRDRSQMSKWIEDNLR